MTWCAQHGHAERGHVLLGRARLRRAWHGGGGDKKCNFFSDKELIFEAHLKKKKTFSYYGIFDIFSRLKDRAWSKIYVKSTLPTHS